MAARNNSVHKAAGLMSRDSNVLYAAGNPAAAIDSYTRRVLKRHGLIEGDEPYEVLQFFFTERPPKDVDFGVTREQSP